jgi:predicted lipid-binding transport protein (Tim44 family)
MNPWIEVLIVAAVAGFVLTRLYGVLGKRSDDDPAQTPMRAPTPNQTADRPEAADPRPIRMAYHGPAAGGLEAIKNADPSFDPEAFLSGARSAYDLIVAAYADGDRDTLKQFLTPAVYEAYDQTLSARETSGVEPFRLLRIKSADISTANIDAVEAEITVNFSADLSNGEEARTVKELWTFERPVNSADPNWRLCAVEPVN